jgi:hypothetical protein
MPQWNLAGSDMSGVPITTARGTRPVTGWARLTLWAAGRALLVLLIVVTAVGWLQVAVGARAASESAGAYAAAVILLAMAVVAFVFGALRVVRVRRVVRDPASQTINPPVVRSRRVRVQCGAGVPDLEWKVLTTRRPLAGPMAIHGSLECGNWLVVRLSDHRLIWPATRAQPVIGTSVPPVPGTAVADLDVAGAHRRLLGAYAQVISSVNALPFLARVPLGEWEPSWWWIGAPRPVIGGLVTAHVRKRLRALGDAHIRAAALTGAADCDASRRMRREASQECQELAGTLRRRTWPALLVSVITFSVPIYLAFFPPHLPKISASVIENIALWIAGLTFLFFASVPLVMLFRSILCQRALFCPGQRALFSNPPAFDRAPTINVSPGWDIYRFEREAFLRAGAREPRQWEGHPLIPWLAAVGYGLGVAIPFTLRTGQVFRGLYILLVVFACSRIFLSVFGYGIRDLTCRLRREQPER